MVSKSQVWWIMGSEITRYSEDMRDSFGQYRILPGHIHVFEFGIPLFGSTTLSISHILPNSQDFTIDMWITEAPLDGLLLEDNFGHFKAKRRAAKFTIYDALLKQDREDPRMFLDSHRRYFINVKNLQNRPNAYELDIEVNLPSY